MKDYFTRENLLKASIFVILLFACNFFLFKHGLWLYGDASFWYKDHAELLRGSLGQFHTFINNGYYYGYDLGFFVFNRIVSIALISILFTILGTTVAQVIFILSAYVLSFLSIYLFLNLFIKDKNTTYILSLFYVFNPLFFSLLNQSYIHVYAAIPLFLYSSYKYFFSEEKIRFIYIAINIFAFYLLISYLRFVEIGLLLALAYLIIWIFLQNKIKMAALKIIVLTFGYILLLAPLLYAAYAQYRDGFNGVSNFSGLFAGNISKAPSYQIFNLFQTNNISLYNNVFSISIGIIFFVWFIYLCLFNTSDKEKKDKFYIFNICLVLIGIAFVGLANIFGTDAYPIILKLTPFIQNVPYYGFYFFILPFVLALGLSRANKKSVIIYCSSFIVFSLIFLVLSFREPEFKKFDLSSIPSDYQEYFLKEYSNLPEATYYLPGACWRATYMSDDVSTPCFNYELRYSRIQGGDGRVLSGNNYLLGNQLANLEDFHINNFVVIDNLKHVIVANDLTESQYGFYNIDVPKKMKEAIKILDANNELNKIKLQNFTDYEFKKSNLYDYFIYSPAVIEHLAMDDVYDDSINFEKNPVILDSWQELMDISSASVFYKASPNNPTMYYIKLSKIPNKPYILELNQSFNQNWRLYVIGKKEFENVKCAADATVNPITNNRACVYSSSIYSLSYSDVAGHRQLITKNHIVGNLLGNAWVIDPNDNKMNEDNGDIYLVLIYQKQIIFSLCVTIFFVSVIVLLSLVILQEIWMHISRRNKK